VTGGRSEISFKGKPHDGRRIGNLLAFTTVRGYVVLVDPDSLEVVATHDLEPMTPGIKTLGWCRGLCEDPRNPNRCFVAFSSLRESPWREYGFRVKNGHPKAPSRVALYDFQRAEVVRTYVGIASRSLVLFQLDALPEALWIEGRQRLHPRRSAIGRRRARARPRALVP
jgi:hypothetical protein